MIFFVFCLVAMALSGPFAVGAWRQLAPRDVLLLLGVGAFSTLAQLLFTGALGYLPAITAAITFPLTPVSAYLFGTLLLGEPLTLRIAFGILVALGGVALGSWTASKPAIAPAID